MIIAVTEVKPNNARLNIEEVELSLKGYELFTKLDGNSRGIYMSVYSLVYEAVHIPYQLGHWF